MKRFQYLLGFIAAISLSVCGCKSTASDSLKNKPVEISVTSSNVTCTSQTTPCPVVTNPNWNLKVATYFTQVDDTYFIVDCYNNQIIYHTNKEAPLYEWKVLTSEVHYPHSISSDGNVYLVDDTENNRVLVFQKATDVEGCEFQQTQVFENVGDHPHFTYYDESRKQFMVWSSYSGEMYYFVYNELTHQVELSKILQLPILDGIYIRSFTMIEDKIYLASSLSNQTIYQCNADTLEIEKTYQVPDKFSGMVQIFKIQDYYYLTVSTDSLGDQSASTILRTKSLEKLIEGDYELLADQLNPSGGTPYYISSIDGLYYLSHHAGSENIIQFEVKDNAISQIKVLY